MWNKPAHCQLHSSFVTEHLELPPSLALPTGAEGPVDWRRPAVTGKSADQQWGRDNRIAFRVHRESRDCRSRRLSRPPFVALDGPNKRGGHQTRTRRRNFRDVDCDQSRQLRLKGAPAVVGEVFRRGETGSRTHLPMAPTAMLDGGVLLLILRTTSTKICSVLPGPSLQRSVSLRNRCLPGSWWRSERLRL